MKVPFGVSGLAGSGPILPTTAIVGADVGIVNDGMPTLALLPWTAYIGECMLVRIRIPELLVERGMTPYALAMRSAGRISLTTAYRLKRSRGQGHAFDSALLEALCDVLEVEPGELLERDGKKKRGRG